VVWLRLRPVRRGLSGPGRKVGLEVGHIFRPALEAKGQEIAAQLGAISQVILPEAADEVAVTLQDGTPAKRVRFDGLNHQDLLNDPIHNQALLRAQVLRSPQVCLDPRSKSSLGYAEFTPTVNLSRGEQTL